MKQEDRRHVLRMINHGLYILASGVGENAIANTVTWLSQSSFTPPLVMVAIRTEGRLHDTVENNGTFTVNIAGADQQKMVAAFFRPAEVKGDSINGYRFESGPESGAPLFIDSPAWFEARVRDVVKGGDHTVFVAEVIAAGVRDPEAKPLALSDTPWTYGG